MHSPALRKVAVASAVVVTSILILAAYLRWQQLEALSDAGPLTPPAMIVSGGLGTSVAGIDLRLVMQNHEGSESKYLGTMDIVNPQNVIIRLYQGQEFFGNELVAGEITNLSQQEITINSFMLEGYAYCYWDKPDICSIRQLESPVISSEYNVIKPTTEPFVLQPGHTLSAYVKGNFYQNAYAASTCYTYDASDTNKYRCLSTGAA